MLRCTVVWLWKTTEIFYFDSATIQGKRLQWTQTNCILLKRTDSIFPYVTLKNWGCVLYTRTVKLFFSGLTRFETKWQKFSYINSWNKPLQRNVHWKCLSIILFPLFWSYSHSNIFVFLREHIRAFALNTALVLCFKT